MNINSIRVDNFKALHDVYTPLSKFCCVIGENNSGKSSLLQTLLLFIKGTKISKQDYYDPAMDVVITAEFTGVTDEDIAVLAEEHRTKIKELVQNETIKLARRYSPDGNSKLMCIGKIVKDKRFRDESFAEIFKGKTGADIEKTLKQNFPELAENSTGITTQKAAKELISSYSLRLPTEQLEEAEKPLPTGIENSIKALLPEPIYIPAVKDVLDDIKTKESTSFGKLLSILLNVIEPKLNSAKETFETLNVQLNKVIKDGNVTDNRMGEVIEIEKTIQKHIEETFPNVSVNVEIPPPEVKTILANARIQVDDGVIGPVESKGDGFKRTITFAIMRSYLELSKKTEWQKEPGQVKTTLGKYLFLFEEPELYLHPKSQKILYNALAKISENHQVLVSTHSPLFFSHEAMGTFIKMTKRPTDGKRTKPFVEALPINISDMNCRDQFQLISYETSNVAFFTKAVVLVEGDSDLIAFPHLSKAFNPDWDFENGSISLVKVNGKGSFRRYKDFFKRFEIEVFILTDLDCILKDFDKLEADETSIKFRSDLLQLLDNALGHGETKGQLEFKLFKEVSQEHKQKTLFQALSETRRKYGDGKCTVEEVIDAVTAFFEFEKEEPRLTILRSNSNPEITKQKRMLIAKLREQNVFVLEKGSIESYYPVGVTGADKPTKAQNFCRLVRTREDASKLCDCLSIEWISEPRPELQVIFDTIFRCVNSRV